MRARDALARKVYETLGVYPGYAVAHHADFHTLRHVLVLGRVKSSGAHTSLLRIKCYVPLFLKVSL